MLAIEDLLAGRPVEVASTQPVGCLIGRVRPAAPQSSVTFTRDIAPVLYKHCVSCHRPGAIAPFSLLTYDDAVRHARMIKEVTSQRRMPPWHADPRYGKFNNDRRLPKEEIDTLAAWVEAGTPRGDAKDEPAPIVWAVSGGSSSRRT